MTTTPSLETISALLVEDNSADARLCRESLAELRHLEVRLERAATVEEALAHLAERRFDLILADLGLPTSSGPATVERLLGPDRTRPLIVLTGSDDPDAAIEALRLGAQDYLAKSSLSPDMLERSIRYALERNRIQGELRDATSALESLLTSFDDVAWAIDADTMGIVYLSSAAERIYGRSFEEFERDSELWKQIVHPDDLAAFRAAWTGISCRGAFELEYRIVRPDGGVRWLYDRGKAVCDDTGRILRYEGIASDISDRRAAEAELARRDIQYRELLEQASDGIVIMDRAIERIELANTAAGRLLGYEVEELFAISVDEVMLPEEGAAGTARARALASGESYIVERNLIHRDGSLLPSEISVTRLADGRIQSIIRDIRERKRVEQALRASEERFRTVVNSLAEGLLITDLDDTVLYANPAACRITGYGPETLVGHRAYELLCPERGEEALDHNRRRSQGQSDRYRHAFRHRDGSERWIEASASPLRDGDGHVVGTVGTLTDITEQLASERALADDERRYRELYNAAERQAQELRLLNEVANRLADAIAPDDIFGTVIDATSEILGYSHICIAMIQDGMLVPRYAVGYPDDLPSLPTDIGISGRVATGGVAVLVEDATADPDYVSADEAVVSSMGVPLRYGDGLVGVLNIESASGPLGERDLRLAQAIATQVGLALHRARLYEQTRDNENQLRAIIDNASDAIYIKDLAGRFLQLNRVVEEQLGLPPGQILGRTSSELLDPREAALLEAVDREVIASGRARSFDRVATLPSGKQRYLSTIKFPYRSSGGEIIGVAAISRDISDRLRSEQLESGQSRVLEMVVRNEPLEAVLGEVAQLLEKLLPGARCAFTIEEGGRLHHRAAPNLPPGFLRATDGLPIEATMGSYGAAFTGAAPVYCRDVAEDALWEGYHDIFTEHGVAALWSVPIVSADDTVLGLLNVHFEQRATPMAGDEALLGSAVRMAAVAIEHGRLLGQLTYQAKHDALTGLPNRFEFEEHLGRAMSAARRDERQLGLLFIDLDRFKHINDTLGHQIGDRLLIQVAERLRLRTRHRDLLARMGGDEFALLLTDLAETATATRVAHNIVKILEAPFQIEGREMFISGSIGVGIFPEDGDDPTTLLANVDRAMYQAKAMGKNNFFSFMPHLNEEAFERLELENRLRRALDKGELSLQFQPELDLVSGEVLGFEALLRWHSERYGSVSPAKFIPLAEETGLIIPIGEWVLRQACLQNLDWRSRGLPPTAIAVNVSALQFSRTDFCDGVERVLAETGHPPEDLILEVTESAVMHDIDIVADKLGRLRALGIAVAIDDFGTGYSSLSYLKRLPVDIIKIDRSFVTDLGAEGDTRRSATALVQAMVTLADGLGIAALAEGVETGTQLGVLRHLGCNYAQGYLFARPRPGDEAWDGVSAARAQRPI